ncbi:MAG: hypothetical protein HXY40_08290 [Chloroflexi bacterium]|nr:hypothetical protein [Chloroflexota bacterium]
MTPTQRKALRFAYQLMRGDFRQHYLPYTSGHWFLPDKDPAKPYLDEANLSALHMSGWLECRAFLRSDMQWLYRITREGCAVLGVDWPLRLIISAQVRQRLQAPRNGYQRRLPLPPRAQLPRHHFHRLPPNFHTLRRQNRRG